MKLVAGLGNPGEQYQATRHNIGFMVAERFASRFGVQLKKKGHQAVFGVGRCNGEEITVLLPQTFMNLSGASVGSALKSLGVDPGDLIVIHDDIDLPFGQLKFKCGGGHGGHNGIRHICQVLGHGDFVRCKIGVGRPAEGGEVVSHVLKPFNAAERKSLDRLLDGAVEALQVMIGEGLAAAMNEFNNRDLSV
ncbi:MAG TPA: aminoacyl-tRNA hydrolase [Geothermobacteraceae bacterium]|nr:aminoacyl-tRNA hydrolase [Geothermobacteraceae bacterium]